MLPDHPQAGRTIAAAAAQHYADDALAEGRRGGGKQGIDGRAGMVDQRAIVEMDASGRFSAIRTRLASSTTAAGSTFR